MERITRSDAQARGLKRFYTGEPCRNGHVAERHVSNRRCVQCVVEMQQTTEWREKNKRRSAAWRNTPTGIASRSLRNVEYQPPEARMRARDASRKQQADKRGHAAPPLERDCPPRPEDGRCECCGADIGASLLVLDHDHDLGCFNGWICHGCNNVGDDIAKLQRRIDYLRARGYE